MLRVCLSEVNCIMCVCIYLTEVECIKHVFE